MKESRDISSSLIKKRTTKVAIIQITYLHNMFCFCLLPYTSWIRNGREKAFILFKHNLTMCSYMRSPEQKGGALRSFFKFNRSVMLTCLFNSHMTGQLWKMMGKHTCSCIRLLSSSTAFPSVICFFFYSITSPPSALGYTEAISAVSTLPSFFSHLVNSPGNRYWLPWICTLYLFIPLPGALFYSFISLWKMATVR